MGFNYGIGGLPYEINVGISGDMEVDFICTMQCKKLYVQVTYLFPDQKVIDSEFGNLLAIKDNYSKMVVSLDEYAPDNIEGIQHVHLQYFLSNFEQYIA